MEINNPISIKNKSKTIADYQKRIEDGIKAIFQTPTLFVHQSYEYGSPYG